MSSQDLKPLEDSINRLRRAVDLAPDDDPEKSAYLNNLGRALQTRFDRLGELDDLEQAILLKQHSVDLTPGDNPNKQGRLNNLGIALAKRFDRTGELGDLERAITLIRRAVNLALDDPSDMQGYLNNLGNVLGTRFDHLGELEDLEQAILSHQRSIHLTPEDHPDKAAILNNLGSALETRFDHLGELDDLEQAVVSKQRAVDLTPSNHPEKPGYLNNLGNALETRFDRLGEMNDLEQSIFSKRRAVDLTPDGHPDKPGLLNNLGNALETRFDRLGQLDDLEQAILSKRRAVDLTPDGHPKMPRYLLMLSRAVMRRAHPLDHSSFNECLEYSLRAADQKAGSPSALFTAAKGAAALAWIAIRAQPGIAGMRALVSIYERIFDLIPQVVWIGKSIGQRYEDLAPIGELVAGGSAAAIAIGDLPRAIEWLDHGRGVVWGQLLQLRNPMDDLRAHDTVHGSNFSERLQSVSLDLESSAHHNGTSIEDHISARIRLADDYRALLHDVRALDGFENFLMPQKYDKLARASTDGPIIIINVHKKRCDALIVDHSADHPLHVPLPDLSLELANGMRSHFVSSLQQARVWERAPVRPFRPDEGDVRGSFSSSFERNASLATVLECLWSCVVHPILQAIEGVVGVPFVATSFTDPCTIAL
jgi:tetratricopeptide (TPR) repeat protein